MSKSNTEVSTKRRVQLSKTVTLGLVSERTSVTKLFLNVEKMIIHIGTDKNIEEYCCLF